MYRYCSACGKLFPAKKKEARYCSGKCRVSWHRDTNRTTNKETKFTGNAKATKSLRVKDVTCSFCNRSFSVNGNTGMRRYCSNACKQSAYRLRTSLIIEWMNSPIDAEKKVD